MTVIPDSDIRLCQVVKPLATPDAPGWWAFEGSEWESQPIWPDDHDPDEEDDDGTYWDEPPVRPLGYRDVEGKPFQTVLLVRYSKPGEVVSLRHSHGRYEGQPFLGYLNTHHPWDHYLHSLDHLVGQWWRLSMPWGEPNG